MGVASIPYTDSFPERTARVGKTYRQLNSVRFLLVHKYIHSAKVIIQVCEKNFVGKVSWWMRLSINLCQQLT